MVGVIVEHWPSLILYMLVFSASAILVYYSLKSTDKKVEYSLSALGVLLPTLLAGLRYGVGKDFSSYSGMVERVQHGLPMWPRPIEPVSSLIIQASAHLGGSTVMFLIFGLLTIVIALLAIRKMVSGQPLAAAISWFLYLMVVLPVTLNTMRSGLAVSFVLLAFSEIITSTTKKSALLSILWFILGIGTHVTAVIFLPIGLATMVFSRLNKYRNTFTITTLAIALCIAIFFPALGNLVATFPHESISVLGRYFAKVGDSYYIPIVNIFMMLILAATYWVNRKIISKDQILRNLYFVSLFFMPVAVMIGWLSYYTGTSRLAFYLDPIVLIILAFSISRVRALHQNSKKITIALIFVTLTVGFTLLVRNSIWAQNLPYKTITPHMKEEKRNA